MFSIPDKIRLKKIIAEERKRRIALISKGIIELKPLDKDCFEPKNNITITTKETL